MNIHYTLLYETKLEKESEKEMQPKNVNIKHQTVKLHKREADERKK